MLAALKELEAAFVAAADVEDEAALCDEMLAALDVLLVARLDFDEVEADVAAEVPEWDAILAALNEAALVAEAECDAELEAVLAVLNELEAALEDAVAAEWLLDALMPEEVLLE